MDWKRFYADELAQPAVRRAVRDAIARHEGGDVAVRSALLQGGVASFPHVTVHDAADAVARVVQSIIAMGKTHVVALGVLHGGTLPAAYRPLWSALGGPSAPAHAAYARLAGAVIARTPATTPFGTIDEGGRSLAGRHLREDEALLAGEFSLDGFLALLAAAAAHAGVRPPAVTRVYVSATRSPDGDLAVARGVAAEVGELIDDDTVCVATGDLAHVGHGYMPPDPVAALPADPAALQSLVLQGIRAQYDAALQRHDFDTAWALGTRWGNDQRHMLPVIATLLGPQAGFEVLSYALSDYAAINGQPAPCRVAAVLGLFRRGAGPET